MSLQGLLAVLRNKKEIDLPQSLIDELVAKYKTESWFSYIVKDRKNRWDLWETSFFLAKTLKSNSPILETGCGASTNLIWFAQQGFTNLNGSDIIPANIEMDKELANKLGIKMDLWIEDGLSPKNEKNEKYDAILSLNWTHLLSNFDLTLFLKIYNPLTNLNGFHCIDVIDSSYNDMPNNQFLTSDISKPSEYKKRYSQKEVEKAAADSGYTVETILKHDEDRIPKRVYILKKISETK